MKFIEDQIEKLYKPYFTLGSKTTGGEKSTGLGLSICHNIMAAHGGQLIYSPTPQGGSSFRLQLPHITH